MVDENLVKRIIAEEINMRLHEIHDESKLIEDFGADSLNIIEIVLALEEEYGIEIDDEQVESWVTVRNVIDCVEDCKSNPKHS
jgi:acyl carrier protein